MVRKTVGSDDVFPAPEKSLGKDHTKLTVDTLQSFKKHGVITVSPAVCLQDIFRYTALEQGCSTQVSQLTIRGFPAHDFPFPASAGFLELCSWPPRLAPRGN